MHLLSFVSLARLSFFFIRFLNVFVGFFVCLLFGFWCCWCWCCCLFGRRIICFQELTQFEFDSSHLTLKYWALRYLVHNHNPFIICLFLMLFLGWSLTHGSGMSFFVCCLFCNIFFFKEMSGFLCAQVFELLYSARFESYLLRISIYKSGASGNSFCLHLFLCYPSTLIHLAPL